MADTYGIDDSWGGPPAPPGGNAAAEEMRREMAKQAVEEGRALQRKRDLAALEERRGRVEQIRLRHLKEEADAIQRTASVLQDTTKNFGRAGVVMGELSDAFQKFASGNVAGGMLSLFQSGTKGITALGGRWQGQADNAAREKHEAEYAAKVEKHEADFAAKLKQHKKDVKAGIASEDDAPEKGAGPKKGTAPGGVSVAASALGALGAAGSLVTQAFQSVASGAMTLWSTMTGFARSVPGVGNALSSVFTLISTKITHALLPKIVDVAAWLVTFSDTIAQVVSDILLACAGFVEWMGKSAAKMMDPTGGMAKAGYDGMSEQAKRNMRIGFSTDGTDPLEKQQAEEKRRRKSFDDNKASIWKTIMAGSYQPQIEQQGDQAWKRIQMGELGTNDIDRQTLDVILKIYQMGEEYLRSQKVAPADLGGFAKFLGGALGFR